MRSERDTRRKNVWPGRFSRLDEAYLLALQDEEGITIYTQPRAAARIVFDARLLLSLRTEDAKNPTNRGG
jgi:hypothetical protein